LDAVVGKQYVATTQHNYHKNLRELCHQNLGNDNTDITLTSQTLYRKWHLSVVVSAFGSSEGSLIITTVLQTLLIAMVSDMNIATALAASRVHNQWMPERTLV
jgi:hypothetical protein